MIVKGFQCQPTLSAKAKAIKENPEIASPSCEFMKTTHLLRNFAKSVAVTQVMKRALVVWKTYEKLVVGPGGPYELASGFGAQGVMRHVCVVNIMRKKCLTATSNKCISIY